MPGYSGNGQAQTIGPDRQVFLWDNDTVTAGQTTGSMSLAYGIGPLDNAFYPWGLSLEAWFSGAPGAFEIDILGANVDIGYPNPGHYVQIGTITSVNSSNVGRFDMPSNTWPRFVCAYLKTLTNAVQVTLQLTK